MYTYFLRALKVRASGAHRALQAPKDLRGQVLKDVQALKALLALLALQDPLLSQVPTGNVSRHLMSSQ